MVPKLKALVVGLTPLIIWHAQPFPPGRISRKPVVVDERLKLKISYGIARDPEGQLCAPLLFLVDELLLPLFANSRNLHPVDVW